MNLEREKEREIEKDFDYITTFWLFILFIIIDFVVGAAAVAAAAVSFFIAVIYSSFLSLDIVCVLIFLASLKTGFIVAMINVVLLWLSICILSK